MRKNPIKLARKTFAHVDREGLLKSNSNSFVEILIITMSNVSSLALMVKKNNLIIFVYYGGLSILIHIAHDPLKARLIRITKDA